MKLKSVSCLGASGFHRLAYREYEGPPGAPTLVCVHGLTRNSRDFDALAKAMSATHRVICPDMPGRGESDDLEKPGDYQFPTYLADVATLIARLDVEKVDYVGTSMGGLIGMFLAGTPGHPLRKLVINDASAVTPKSFIAHIATYVGVNMDCGSLDELIERVRASYAPQPDLSAEQWRDVALASANQTTGGGYRFAYDSHIGDVYQTLEPADVVLWPFWDKVELRHAAAARRRLGRAEGRRRRRNGAPPASDETRRVSRLRASADADERRADWGGEGVFGGVKGGARAKAEATDISGWPRRLPS